MKRDRLFTLRLSELELKRLERVRAHLGISGAEAIRYLMKKAEREILASSTSER